MDKVEKAMISALNSVWGNQGKPCRGVIQTTQSQALAHGWTSKAQHLSAIKLRTGICQACCLCCCVLSTLCTLLFAMSFKNHPMRWEECFSIRALLAAGKGTPYQNGVNNGICLKRSWRKGNPRVIHNWALFLATCILSPPVLTFSAGGCTLLRLLPSPCWGGCFQTSGWISVSRGTVKGLISFHVPLISVTEKLSPAEFPSQFTCLISRD